MYAKKETAEDFLDFLGALRQIGEREGALATPDDEEIATVLGYDALREAEQRTGKSYKDDDPTKWAGMLDHVRHGGRKDAVLTCAGDTTLSNDLDRYLAITDDEGFETVLTLPFVGRSPYQASERRETLFVRWHPDGILLVFDTHEETHVNGGSFYYNIQPKNGDPQSFYGTRVTSSGGWSGRDGQPQEWVWVGDHDCREALRFHLRRLREVANFVTPWLYDPRPWLCHYMDHTNTDGSQRPYSPSDTARYRALTQERLALLPGHVRQAVAVSLEDRR